MGTLSDTIIAVDGGGSKTDAVALGPDGSLRARARGGPSSPHAVGLDSSVRTIDALIHEMIGPTRPLACHVYLSGLDLRVEVEEFTDACAGRPWADALHADNDILALLRTGTDRDDAVAVVCGTGINAVGVRDGIVRVRFPSLGELSGDWGGGDGLGRAALWHAARAVDGRGPDTVLTRRLPALYGRDTVTDVIEAVHLGRLARSRLAELCPLVFDCADEGDRVCAGLTTRQADEIVTLATVGLDRLGSEHARVPVVLGGGVLAAGRRLLDDAVEEGISRHTPSATVVFVREPPIVGAARLALASVGVGHAERARADAAISG